MFGTLPWCRVRNRLHGTIERCANLTLSWTLRSRFAVDGKCLWGSSPAKHDGQIVRDAWVLFFVHCKIIESGITHAPSGSRDHAWKTMWMARGFWHLKLNRMISQFMTKLPGKFPVTNDTQCLCALGTEQFQSPRHQRSIPNSKVVKNIFLFFLSGHFFFTGDD